MRPRKRKLDLVGIKEAAELIGWSRQKTSVYYRRGLLPPPVAELACGPIWYLDDVARFAEREREALGEKVTAEAMDQPAHCMYRARVPMEGWPHPPTLYWSSRGEYVFCDDWKKVIATHDLGYYQACLQRGIVGVSDRVVDVDGLLQTLVARGERHAEKEVKSPGDVKHPEALKIMEDWEWFGPTPRGNKKNS